ncbi:Cytochrome c oxidase subunit 3-like protein [Drosera capensis]
MESLDLVLNGKSLDDIMYQRMKNRERQRRYRERKRLQAGNFNRSLSKNAPTANPPAEPSHPSPWPISGSLGALATTVGGVMYMHSFQGGATLLSLGLLKRTANQHIIRVHCTRDWKKDARRVHAIKQEVPSVPLPSYGVASTGENHGSYSTSASEQCANGGGASASMPGVDARGKDRTKTGRRDWKAEARNKKL